MGRPNAHVCLSFTLVPLSIMTFVSWACLTLFQNLSLYHQGRERCLLTKREKESLSFSTKALMIDAGAAAAAKVWTTLMGSRTREDWGWLIAAQPPSSILSYWSRLDIPVTELLDICRSCVVTQDQGKARFSQKVTEDSIPPPAKSLCSPQFCSFESGGTDGDVGRNSSNHHSSGWK